MVAMETERYMQGGVTSPSLDLEADLAAVAALQSRVPLPASATGTPSCRKQKRGCRMSRWKRLLVATLLYLGFSALAMAVRVMRSEDVRDTWDFSDVKVQRARRDTHTQVWQPSLAEEEDSENCTPRAIHNFPPDFFSLEDTQDGGVFIHILLSCYMFAALAIVCDDYFVPSLERICEDLKLHPDVAGATFMAAGSSAPELVTSIIGVFVAKSDVGVGTIVGSAVFNILFIIGACAIFGGAAVIQLTWWPVARDTVFYLFSVLALILVIMDGEVYWYEALVMVVMFVLYILLMVFNSRLETLAYSRTARCCGRHGNADADVTQPLLGSQSQDSMGSSQRQPAMPKFLEGETSLDSGITRQSDGSQDSSKKEEEEEKSVESPWEIPQSFLLRILWVAMVPMKALLYVTVPDCRLPRWRRWYMVTFLMAIVWIVACTYLVVWMITIAGDALGIPDTVMGLSLLAAGTSVPDCLSSVFVARDGFGDMAVSNSVGSNVFDILICLGLPWLLETAAINSGQAVVINSSGLTYSSITLLSTVAFLLAALAINRWRLTKPLGVVFLLMYLLVIALSCLYELNIFGDFNQPPCPR